MCYKQVGDSGIVREHLTKAANGPARGRRQAPPGAGPSPVGRAARTGRTHRGSGDCAFGQAERLATAIRADDVLASTAHNRANPGADDAPARRGARHSPSAASRCTRRSAAATAWPSASRRSARSTCRSATWTAPSTTLNRALEVRSPIKFHETTGAVFDTLAQIHLMRGNYDRASEYLRQAGEAYGAQGAAGRAVVRVVGEGAGGQDRHPSRRLRTTPWRWPTSWRRRRHSADRRHPGRPRGLRGAARSRDAPTRRARA